MARRSNQQAAAGRTTSPPSSTTPQPDDVLDAVVQQSTPQPGQIVLGHLLSVDATGRASVRVPALGDLPVIHSLIALQPSLAGQAVALSLLHPQQALVLGLVWAAQTAPTQPRANAPTPSEYRVIEASDCIELRCGDASILLLADGRIQIRGHYITSQATATHRILGGSVNVK